MRKKIRYVDNRLRGLSIYVKGIPKGRIESQWGGNSQRDNGWECFRIEESTPYGVEHNFKRQYF